VGGRGGPEVRFAGFPGLGLFDDRALLAERLNVISRDIRGRIALIPILASCGTTN